MGRMRKNIQSISAKKEHVKYKERGSDCNSLNSPCWCQRTGCCYQDKIKCKKLQSEPKVTSATRRPLPAARARANPHWHKDTHLWGQVGCETGMCEEKIHPPACPCAWDGGALPQLKLWVWTRTPVTAPALTDVQPACSYQCVCLVETGQQLSKLCEKLIFKQKHHLQLHMKQPQVPE